MQLLGPQLLGPQLLGSKFAENDDDAADVDDVDDVDDASTVATLIASSPPPNLHLAFVQRVAGFLGKPTIDALTSGEDNGERSPVPPASGERRLWRENPVRLTAAFVEARDGAMKRLRHGGYWSCQVEDALKCALAPTLVKLTGLLLMNRGILREVNLDVRNYLARNPEHAAVVERPRYALTRASTPPSAYAVPPSWIHAANRFLAP